MTNRAKGWLMLSPLVLIYFVCMYYLLGQYILLVLAMIAGGIAVSWYINKALDLMSEYRNKRS